MATITYQEVVRMVTETCCKCGIIFGISKEFNQRLINNHETFYCPNGHGQNYRKPSESVEEKFRLKELELKAKLDRAEQNLTIAYNRVGEESAKVRVLEKKMKRVHKGVCPCCNRTFQNLSEHMKTQHPEISKPNISKLPKSKISKP